MNHVCNCASGADALISQGVLGAPNVLLRSAYETAVRLLWASGEPNGWNRELFRWAREDVKAAKGSIEAGHCEAHMESVLRHRESLVSVWEEIAPQEQSKRPPTIEQMLRDIEKQPGLTEYSPLAPFGDADWHYSVMYRPLSMFVHGHWVAVGIGQQVPDVLSAALANVFCAQALCVVATRMAGDQGPHRTDVYLTLINNHFRSLDALAEESS